MDYQSGILTQITGSPFQTGFIRETTLVPSPDGKFLYVLSGSEDSAVESFAVGTDGKLYGQQTYSLSGGTYPTAMAVDTAGKFLYVTFTYQPGFTPASPGPGGVTIFPINSDDTLGTPVNINGQPLPRRRQQPGRYQRDARGLLAHPRRLDQHSPAPAPAAPASRTSSSTSSTRRLAQRHRSRLRPEHH